MPWPLMEAITHGLSVLSWFENYQSEEIPPETVWDDSDAVEEWFKRVRQKQKEKFEFPGSTSGDDSSDEGEGTDNSMMGNDYADFFKK